SPLLLVGGFSPGRAKNHRQKKKSTIQHMSSMIDSVRGMRDVLPQELAGQLAIAAQLDQALAGYGYQPIELPIIEQRDLYGRKLGEELVGKVYEFSFSGRELALRP